MRKILIFLLCLVGSLLNGVAQEMVHFSLNTTGSYEKWKIDTYGPVTFDPSEEVKLYCHGWISSLETTEYEKLKEEYIKRGVKHIAGVDWSAEANHWWYPTSLDLMDDVGRKLANLLVYLEDEYHVPVSRVHLIGHSLGAHVCGIAGRYIKSTKKATIGRITGLDPAGPAFYWFRSCKTLSADDATFVDIIHTARVLGFISSIGHVDFYPNNGYWQPACFFFGVTCSHGISQLYFIESINNGSFVALACDSYRNFKAHRCDNKQSALMGENVDRSARGDFYLRTNPTSPFGLGHAKSEGEGMTTCNLGLFSLTCALYNFRIVLELQ